MSCSSTVAALFLRAAWKRLSRALWRRWCVPSRLPRLGRLSQFMSGRCSAAPFFCSTAPIDSNSLLWATCAHPALPTCLWPSWATMSKEQLDEHSVQPGTGILWRFALERARCPIADPAHVLVGAQGVVGEPLDLCGPARSGGRLPGGLFDQPVRPPSWHACHCIGALDAGADRACHAIQSRGNAAYARWSSRRRVLFARRPAWRAPRSQHPVLEVPAGFRSYDRAFQGEHSACGAAGTGLRNHSCPANRNAAGELGGGSRHRLWRRRTLALAPLLPDDIGAALQPGGDHALVCSDLLLDAAGFGMGEARDILVGGV